MIGLPSQSLGYILCLYVNSLHVDVTAEIELRDIGAECKVSLDDLCKKAIDGNLKNGTFPHVLFTQASTLIGATDVAWRKLDLARLACAHQFMFSLRGEPVWQPVSITT